MIIEIDQTKFAQIEKAVNNACKKAVEIKLDCGANFGDLHCFDVQYCVESDGAGSWLAFVEECSPDDYKLINFIYEELKKEEFKNVFVRTEW